MHSSRLAIALLVFASACLAGDETDTVEDTSGESAHVTVTQEMATTEQVDDICDLLPECGACSLVCDPDELAEQYVPPGTCVAFVCELTDGRQIGVHACNH